MVSNAEVIARLAEGGFKKPKGLDEVGRAALYVYEWARFFSGRRSSIPFEAELLISEEDSQRLNDLALEVARSVFGSQAGLLNTARAFGFLD